MDKGPSLDPVMDLCLQLNPKHGGEYSGPTIESLGEKSLRHQVSSLQRELETTKAALTSISSDLVASEMLAEQRLERITELECQLSKSTVSSNSEDPNTFLDSSLPANTNDEAVLKQSQESAEKEDPTLPQNRLSGADVTDLHTTSSVGGYNLTGGGSEVQVHDKEVEELRRLVKFYKENSEKTSQMVRELEVTLTPAVEPTCPGSFGRDASTYAEIRTSEID